MSSRVSVRGLACGLLLGVEAIGPKGVGDLVESNAFVLQVTPRGQIPAQTQPAQRLNRMTCHG
jgi:hypothetical protein